MGNYEVGVCVKEGHNSSCPIFIVVKDLQIGKHGVVEREAAGIRILIVDLAEQLGIVNGKN